MVLKFRATTEPITYILNTVLSSGQKSKLGIEGRNDQHSYSLEIFNPCHGVHKEYTSNIFILMS